MSQDELRTKKILLWSFLAAEGISILLLLITRTHWFYFVFLTALNALSYWIIKKIYSVESKRKITKKDVLRNVGAHYSAKLNLLILVHLLVGVVILTVSHFFYPKLYALGLSMLLMSAGIVIFKIQKIDSTKHIKELPLEKLRSSVVKGKIATIGNFFIIPVLLDSHYMILNMSFLIYLGILVIFTVVTLGLGIYSLRQFPTKS